jgi:DNA-binding transcriptional regulator YdaS (Cro superfamily)
MKLETYLELTGLEKKQFAKLIGICPQSISNYLHLKRKPSLSIACRIEVATKGKVTVHDLWQFWEENTDG